MRRETDALPVDAKKGYEGGGGNKNVDRKHLLLYRRHHEVHSDGDDCEHI